MSSPGSVNEPLQRALTVGEQLQAAREARGWSAAEVATRLRIRTALVEALERDDYTSFLAATYARGQVRNYAHLTGLDAQALLAQFEMPPPGPAGRALHRAPELHPRRPWLVRLGACAVVGVLIVLGAMWAGADRSSQAPPTPLAPTEIAGRPAAAPVAEPTMPALTPDTAQPAAAAESSDGVSPDVSAAAASLSTQAVSSSAQGAGPGANSPSTPRAEPAALAGSSPPEPAQAARADAQLRLRSHAVSWVEVTDRHGQRLIYELVGPDQQRVVRGEAPLRLLLGNAPAVEVVFAGQQVALPPGQHVVRLTLGSAPQPADAGANTPPATPIP